MYCVRFYSSFRNDEALSKSIMSDTKKYTLVYTAQWVNSRENSWDNLKECV